MIPTKLWLDYVIDILPLPFGYIIYTSYDNQMKRKIVLYKKHIKSDSGNEVEPLKIDGDRS